MTTWSALGYIDADVELDDDVVDELAGEGAFEREPTAEEWTAMEDAMGIDAGRAVACGVAVVEKELGPGWGRSTPCGLQAATTCARCHKPICVKHREVVEIVRHGGDSLEVDLCRQCELVWRILDAG